MRAKEQHMSSRRSVALAALGWFVFAQSMGSASLHGEPTPRSPQPVVADRPNAPIEKPAPDTSAAEVVKRLGQPKRISRQILAGRRSVEQWVYEEPFFWRIEMKCVRGQEPQVLTVQTIRPGKP